MKNLLLILVLSLLSIQSFAGSCPDGSEPVKSISADGTYFVYKCAADSNNSQKSTQVKVKASNINFPGKFYTTEIKSCKAMDYGTFSSNEAINKVEGLIGYDWHADHHTNSTSMNVWHQAITDPINMLMVATHNAIGNDNQANIKIAKNLLIELAETDTLYDSIGYYDVKKKPLCYAGRGDINAPCWYHEYEFARNVFSNYMITALWLKEELNKQEFNIVNKYIKKMYMKFIQPTELQIQEQGFYAMANGGTSILVYASWTNNKKLAAKEINFRFQEMDRVFYEDGYINNNSFRGYRGQWYHSYGVNIALGYVYIADLWGAEVPKKLQKKLIKASEVVNLAITDWDKFKSRKFTGGKIANFIPKDHAIKHTHQYAFAIDTLMKIITGVELERDPKYLQKREYQIKESLGVDQLIGFNPNCTLKALALANSPEELAKQEAKRIEAASELSIFKLDGETFNLTIDKVDFSETGPFELEREEEGYLKPFQLHKGHINGYLNTKSNGIKKFRTIVYKYADTEEQKLVIHVDNPTIKSLKRHKDSLQKLKCGLDEIEWGWLSFISQTNDIKSARIQQCVHDYFKEANDREAWELFQAVLGGTDSILDYLQTSPEERRIEVATKEEEKRISVDLELPIFDDVEYKLEGQILKINIRDPKMKPIVRHIGSLLTKCGVGSGRSGLIDTKSGWISFVSSNSNSRTQQCHYDYFQKSNDSEAFELFKAVLSGTDSILDYLETSVSQ